MAGKKNLFSPAAQDLIKGWIATQALEWATSTDVHAFEAALDKLTRALGKPLPKEELELWAQRLHKGAGFAGGIAYSALRSRGSKFGGGYAIAFGVAAKVIMRGVEVYKENQLKNADTPDEHSEDLPKDIPKDFNDKSSPE